MNKVYYFAYGSNINSKNMHKTCPNAKALGISLLNDYEFSFMGNKGSAIACVFEKLGKSVPVVVWELPQSDLGKLTNYVTLPYLYKKYEKQVVFGGKKLKGIMYFPTLNLKACLPNQDYISTLREGYTEHGMDMSVLDEAIQQTKGE